MKDELNNIFINEIEAIEKLLTVLEKQHNCLVWNDAFGMEACVKDIDNCNKLIAEWEIKRRNLTGEKSLRDLMEEIKNEELENNYRQIKLLVQKTIVQKDINKVLIQQGLGYTNRMLSIINPDRKAKTYNSYGKIFK